jgi:hypothetical protein
VYPSRETVDRIKAQYPIGTSVALIKMNDPYAPPVGTPGVVTDIDDIGSLLVKWQNGSRLHVIYGEDVVRKVGSNDN